MLTIPWLGDEDAWLSIFLPRTSMCWLEGEPHKEKNNAEEMTQTSLHGVRPTMAIAMCEYQWHAMGALGETCTIPPRMNRLVSCEEGGGRQSRDAGPSFAFGWSCSSSQQDFICLFDRERGLFSSPLSARLASRFFGLFANDFKRPNLWRRILAGSFFKIQKVHCVGIPNIIAYKFLYSHFLKYTQAEH